MMLGMYDEQHCSAKTLPGDPGIASDKASIGSTCKKQKLNWVNLQAKIKLDQPTTSQNYLSQIQHSLKVLPPPLGLELGRAEQNLSINVKCDRIENHSMLVHLVWQICLGSRRAPDPVSLRVNKALAAVLLGYPFCLLHLTLTAS